VHRLADSAPDPPSAQPTKVAVDETAVTIDDEWSWVYATIDLDTTLILGVELFGRHGTDPAAAFLHKLTEQHDLSDAELLVNQLGHWTALARLGLSGRVSYIDRNLIEKWFHIFTMRVDRFHTSWVGSQRRVRWRDRFELVTHHSCPPVP